MRLIAKVLLILVLASAVLYAAVTVERVSVPKGTEVVLVFDRAISSKTLKAGESVDLHVLRDVNVARKVILKAGTKVTAKVVEATGVKPKGVNAKLRISIHPVITELGGMIDLAPRLKGKEPAGMVDGYFIHAKTFDIKAGDQLVAEISRTKILERK